MAEVSRMISNLLGGHRLAFIPAHSGISYLKGGKQLSCVGAQNMDMD